MKKKLILSLAALLLLLALLAVTLTRAKPQKFSASFFGTFDTIVTVTGYAGSEAAFQKEFQAVQEIFTRCHRLFDGYNAYDGINNLYVLNRDAAQAPVPVDAEMFDLLERTLALNAETATDAVNIAMGSVLRLWHEAREISEKSPEMAYIPAMEALSAANAHTDIQSLVLDKDQRTVFYADPELKLDLGAVAKGYAAEKAAEYLETSSMPSFIINAGGNVRVGAKPADGRDSWKVGVENPFDPQTLADAVAVVSGSVVTSGDYQRYYMLNGQRCHHIISPETLMPADRFRSVTIVTPDSARADFLSTALFILPYEEGEKVARACGADVLWIMADGSVRMTDGYRARSSTWAAAE